MFYIRMVQDCPFRSCILSSLIPPPRRHCHDLFTIIPSFYDVYTTWFALPPLFRKVNLHQSWYRRDGGLIWSAFGRSRLLNSVSTALPKSRLDSSLWPLRPRGLLVKTVCKFLSFGNVITKVFFVLYYYFFGPAAAPFSVTAWSYNGATLRSGLTRNITWGFVIF
jgi:hypothetical protein